MGTKISTIHRTVYGAEIKLVAEIHAGERATHEYPGHGHWIEWEEISWRGREIEIDNLKKKHAEELEYVILHASEQLTPYDFV